MDKHDEVAAAARAVLEKNDQGTHTIPAAGLYPHQWLWDSCFIAIGIRHYDVFRAQQEILSLLRGQWSNGMLPHMVLSNDKHARDNKIMWRSWLSPYSPHDVGTSGMTQPPMIAEAVVQIGKKLNKTERHTWYKTMYQPLLRHHQWLYADRDPHQEGLALIVHPWESGYDNSPPWVKELHEHLMPGWIRLIDNLQLEGAINLFRRDTKYVPAKQRLSAVESMTFYDMHRRLRRKGYDINKILPHSMFTIEDVSFNSIFIRANTHLRNIAKAINEQLPKELLTNMQRTETALEQLWDPYSSFYYSRNFVTHQLIKEPTISTLMPLYAGCISKERAKQLVGLIHNSHLFGTDYPLPSVPANSEWFQPYVYWQGPSWVNTNWLVIDGLRQYGFDEEANAIAASTIEMVEQYGCYEYFSPLDGTPAGAPDFSWTAALAMDLLENEKTALK